KSQFNIVAIDLPHVPPKTPGPDSAYARSAELLKQWLESELLIHEKRPAIYPYEQTYTLGERTFHRRGFFALVKLTPFGIDVIPHEQTYAGAIEDRLKLMQATSAQLSPVFGLFFDPKHEVVPLLFKNVMKPIAHATIDNVRNELWSITDADIERQIIDMMSDKNIYIADGHHRYTTALHYQNLEEQKHGGKLPPNHPANYALFVLVPADDPGVSILPTHRLIAGLDRFDLESFFKAIEPHFKITRTKLQPDHLDELAQMLRHEGANAFGVYDGKSKTVAVIKLKDKSLLASLEPSRSEDWHSLDVAIVQRYLIEEVLTKFSSSGNLTRGYTADDHQVQPMVDSGQFQLALLLQPTPVRALGALGKTGEVMPPKSTYFFPKLATGVIIAPLN
ncbi:MAG TPA: DUF1015 domain-containing protein, partial [Tepidisphaeraceae bacterium]|nr:DUF1015 domain-containing protein [Tepidisphaeraceae bacterium]